jgi:hypothetical protein
VMARRYDANGTPLNGSRFSLARFGSGASAAGNMGVTNIDGDDTHGVFTIVCGQTGYTNNPMVTLNFIDGPRGFPPPGQTPYVLAKLSAPMVPTSANLWNYGTPLVEVTVSPTNITWMIAGTPSGSANARARATIRYWVIA